MYEKDSQRIKKVHEKEKVVRMFDKFDIILENSNLWKIKWG